MEGLPKFGHNIICTAKCEGLPKFGHNIICTAKCTHSTGFWPSIPHTTSMKHQNFISTFVLMLMRYEDRYDLIDEEYLRWLNTYPNAVPF